MAGAPAQQRAQPRTSPNIEPCLPPNTTAQDRQHLQQIYTITAMHTTATPKEKKETSPPPNTRKKENATKHSNLVDRASRRTAWSGHRNPRTRSTAATTSHAQQIPAFNTNNNKRRNPSNQLPQIAFLLGLWALIGLSTTLIHLWWPDLSATCFNSLNPSCNSKIAGTASTLQSATKAHLPHSLHPSQASQPPLDKTNGRRHNKRWDRHTTPARTPPRANKWRQQIKYRSGRRHRRNRSRRRDNIDPPHRERHSPSNTRSCNLTDKRDGRPSPPADLTDTHNVCTLSDVQHPPLRYSLPLHTHLNAHNTMTHDMTSTTHTKIIQRQIIQTPPGRNITHRSKQTIQHTGKKSNILTNRCYLIRWPSCRAPPRRMIPPATGQVPPQVPTQLSSKHRPPTHTSPPNPHTITSTEKHTQYQSHRQSTTRSSHHTLHPNLSTQTANHSHSHSTPTHPPPSVTYPHTPYTQHTFKQGTDQTKHRKRRHPQKEALRSTHCPTVPTAVCSTNSLNYTQDNHTNQNINPPSPERSPLPDQTHAPCHRNLRKSCLTTPPHHPPRSPPTHTRSKLAPAITCTPTNTHSQWPHTAKHSPHTTTHIKQESHLLNTPTSPPRNTHPPTLVHNSERSSHCSHSPTLLPLAPLTHSPPKDTHMRNYRLQGPPQGPRVTTAAEFHRSEAPGAGTAPVPAPTSTSAKLHNTAHYYKEPTHNTQQAHYKGASDNLTNNNTLDTHKITKVNSNLSHSQPTHSTYSNKLTDSVRPCRTQKHTRTRTPQQRLATDPSPIDNHSAHRPNSSIGQRPPTGDLDTRLQQPAAPAHNTAPISCTAPNFFPDNHSHPPRESQVCTQPPSHHPALH